MVILIYVLPDICIFNSLQSLDFLGKASKILTITYPVVNKQTAILNTNPKTLHSTEVLWNYSQVETTGCILS